ncbi:MAG: tRNA lysidine(34) synthetase TilS [Cyanobium sp.]
MNSKPDQILPSRPGPVPRSRGAEALRLHRWLRQRPQLLPRGARLLLAVSGGQDSMALTSLMRDLQPLHGWDLALWHGDHGWHVASAVVAQELRAWGQAQGLVVWTDRAAAGEAKGEAAARRWRYGCLAQQARRWDCRHVLTGHTASDRAETVLLNLARGCHRRGLASLGSSRPLTELGQPGPSAALVRPLLIFDRADTGRLCQRLQLPLWLDPSNADTRLRRNRLRAEVLPVLEDCHPGAVRRISQQAERLAAELTSERELLVLALQGLERPGVSRTALDRPLLMRLSTATRGRLLARWLEQHTGRCPNASAIDSIVYRIAQPGGNGHHDLSRGWRLKWSSSLIFLCRTSHERSDANFCPS